MLTYSKYVYKIAEIRWFTQDRPKYNTGKGWFHDSK